MAMAEWLEGERSVHKLLFVKIGVAISVPLAGYFFYRRSSLPNSRVLPDSFSNHDKKHAIADEYLARESKAELLSAKIDSLLVEKRRLEEQLFDYSSAMAELQSSRTEINDLKRKIEADSTSAQKKINDLEREIEDLRTKISNLEKDNKELSENFQSVAKVSEEEITNLRRRNGEMSKEIEKIQADRCADVEEVVYLKWVNACLRHELRNYHKSTSGNLSKTLSPESENKIKQIINEEDDFNVKNGVNGKMKFIAKLKKLVLRKETDGSPRRGVDHDRYDHHEENDSSWLKGDVNRTVASRCKSDLGASWRTQNSLEAVSCVGLKNEEVAADAHVKIEKRLTNQIYAESETTSARNRKKVQSRSFSFGRNSFL
ncbi:uncharacterized protein LOC144709726 [Wolffia australiana]